QRTWSTRRSPRRSPGACARPTSGPRLRAWSGPHRWARRSSARWRGSRPRLADGHSIASSAGRLTAVRASHGAGSGQDRHRDWRRLTAVNIDGVFLAIKYALPVMRRGSGGSIIIMSSVAGLRGYPGFAAYCASKGAVRLLAKAAAMECAAAGDNIRVNSVHPGFVDTPIWPADVDVHERAKAVVPMARAGEAREVAKGVLFLASDAASYMTGTELVLDGGLFGGSVRTRR